MSAGIVAKSDELTPSIEELKKFNAELRSRIDDLEARIQKMKSAAENNLRKILGRAPDGPEDTK